MYFWALIYSINDLKNSSEWEVNYGLILNTLKWSGAR